MNVYNAVYVLPGSPHLGQKILNIQQQWVGEDSNFWGHKRDTRLGRARACLNMEFGELDLIKIGG